MPAPRAAMLCLFVVLVHTSEDMVLLKRVNNQNKMLEGLRRKLMEDNFDYEHKASEASVPSESSKFTRSILNERKKFIPDVLSEPSKFLLSYQPQYSGHGGPLPEQRGNRRRALDITDGDPVIYV